MVILDNHVSRADWCCSETDGNGFWYNADYPETEEQGTRKGFYVVCVEEGKNSRLIAAELSLSPGNIQRHGVERTGIGSIELPELWFVDWPREDLAIDHRRHARTRNSE